MSNPKETFLLTHFVLQIDGAQAHDSVAIYLPFLRLFRTNLLQTIFARDSFSPMEI